MIYALKNIKNDSTIAIVVANDKNYKDDVIVIGNSILKRQLDNQGFPVPTQASKLLGREVSFLKRSDPDCAKLFLEVYIPSTKGDYAFVEMDVSELSMTIKGNLKSR